jgi:secreted PhoX family phosphatase
MTSRRNFLRSTMAGGSLLGIEALMTRGLGACAAERAPVPGYGILRPIASENTGETLLALPEGFHYTAFGRSGDPMTDGRPTPPDHDGMAAFQYDGAIRLVRNHESYPHTPEHAVAIGSPGRSYDRKGPGGATTLVIDPHTRLPTSHFVSLSGTVRNCAGGPTPWGSWISCEETLMGPAEGLELSHGYCFEVPVASDQEGPAVPLKAMGRFVHEAVAVDPASGIVYETEDSQAAGFYRFLPARREHLAEGGQLEMLAIDGQPNYDTRTGQQVGRPLRCRWVSIDAPDPDLGQNQATVYAQGGARGGATFARLEGCWYGGGNIYLNSTSGGNARLGQVWQYRPQGEDAGELRLIFESSSPAMLESPDNICVSPRGGLILCEDGPSENFVRGLTREGQIFDLAQNLEPKKSEFAGATFSPDGETLFLNIQTPGITLAIWGDWERGVL